MSPLHLIRVALLLSLTFVSLSTGDYYGVSLGEWKPPLLHALQGHLYALSKDEILIKGFTYDGEGPPAYFTTAKRGYPGITETPNNKGVRIPYPTGFSYSPQNSPKLKAYTNKDVILKLPFNIADIAWFQVYSEVPAASYGHILIPPGFTPPAPATLKSFTENARDLKSGNILVLNHRTIFIPDLRYDGKGPDAFFLVGPKNGPSKPNKNGIKIPTHRGGLAKLTQFTGQELTLLLPEEYSIDKIKWLSVFSPSANQNFGDIKIPANLSVPFKLDSQQISDNCLDVIKDKLQLEWEVSGDTIYFKLWAAIEETQWAGIGFKKADDEPKMIHSDAIIVYQVPTHEHQFHAEDYYISSYDVCTRKAGVCPDAVFESDVGEDNVDVDHSRSTRVDGVSLFTFSRLLAGTDKIKDTHLNQTLKIFGAFGERNTKSNDIGLSYEQILPHKSNDAVNNSAFIPIDFRSDRIHTCNATLRQVLRSRSLTKKPVKRLPFPKSCLSDTREFLVDVGPTGGDRGYSAITGLPSWGFSFWINGKLAPELCLRKGETYTFKIHGGSNSRGNGVNFHPFYITDDSVGGYRHKDKDERAKVKVIRGVDLANPDHPLPIWTGQYCEWMAKDSDDDDILEKAKDFCEFKKSLERRCDPVDSRKKKVTWNVSEKDLPKTLYYQCYTHTHFGWKIHVLEKGEACPCLNTSSRKNPQRNKLIPGLLLTYATLQRFFCSQLDA